MRTRLVSCLAVLPLLSSAGCGGDEPINSNDVKIVQVDPSSAPAGVPTAFVITVTYRLVPAKPQGVISYCFTPQGQGVCLLEEDERVVGTGSGSAQFTAVKMLSGPSNVIVFLADWPHPPSWDPLDTDAVAVSTTP